MKVKTIQELLQSEPYRFEFFQAVRLVQLFHDKQSRVGYAWSTESEAVRLRPLPTLSFPPSEVVEYLPPNEQRRQGLMTIACFGLYGVSGALPTHYTQLILDLERDVRGPERRAFREWLDLFNHRLSSLFYRAWEKYHVALPFERGAAFAREPDSFTAMLLSFVGLGQPTLRHRFAIFPSAQPVLYDEAQRTEQPLAGIEDVALLRYSGLLASRRPRNAWGLQAILGDFFDLNVKVIQFLGQWLSIPKEGLSQAGVSGRLGVDAVAGSHVWNVQCKFRVRIGPLPWDRFLEFLPDRSPIAQRKSLFLLMQLIRFYAGVDFDFDVQLVLDRRTVPAAQLDSTSPLGIRLGWNSWLVQKTPECDPDDAVFEGEELHCLAAV